MTTVDQHAANFLRRIGWDAVMRVPKLGACWIPKPCPELVRYRGDLVSLPRIAVYAWNYPVPDDLKIFQKCGHPRCVNSAHVGIGGPVDTAKRRRADTSLWAARPSNSAKLSAHDVEEIRKDLAAGGSLRKLAEKYQVTKTTIHNVKSGKNYAAVYR